MKKLLKLSLLLCISLSLFSCKGMFGGSKEDELENGNTTRQVLKFSPSGAKALALVDSNDIMGNVGARNATTEGMIQKILEDGSLESFISVPEGVSLSQISYIAQSPAADANEVYIVFSSSTWYGYNDPDTGKWVDGQIGQLLCVFEDGTYDDILKTNDNEWKWLYGTSEDSIAFDNQGGMYYLVSEGSGNTNTNMIYKYDKTTATSIQLTPAVPNTYYQKFQVSNDGKWIFAKAGRWTDTSSVDYLRVIPVDDPTNYNDLFNSSGSSGWVNDWIYDNDNKCIYFNLNGTMYEVPEVDGKYSKENRKILFSGDSNGWFNYSDYNSFLEWTHSSSNYDYRAETSVYNGETWVTCQFRNKMTAEQEVQIDEVYKYFLYKPYETFTNLAIQGRRNEDETYKKITDEFDIRFDVFADVEGFEMLATETEGLKNKELFEAISDKGLVSLFANVFESPRYARYGAGYYSLYEHNFFADVLYKKDTNTKIENSLFNHDSDNTVMFTSNGLYLWDVFEWCDSGSSYTWKTEYTTTEKNSNGKDITVVDAEKVLECMAKFCGTKASQMTFKLTAFKDMPKYAGLYTDKKDEEAIKFLDNPARIGLMTRYMDENWDQSNGNAKFLYITCFKKDTDEPAYTWKTNSSNTIWWGNVSNLTTSYGKSLYGSYDYEGKKCLVEILNKDGVATGTYVSSLDGYAVVSTVVGENGFYFQNAILDSDNESTGKHQIQYYDVVTDQVKNLFANISDNQNIEVINFSIGGDYVYYCGVKGFDIMNGKINTTTLAAETLNSTQKLSQIMAVK